ncbi:hypothetical protein TVAG_089640 [Trichomonas vaginalis G3]|uniref:Uncharacterized protein n=1 Tax=Trichomonas vaginalis (strain ATCC PRA-98 / G3) TaxID=412133 RepID=A2G0T8_TRIV3|nr:hypothetical protein TVAGG3_0656280 [Trichomonas vaginalis G3]EAX89226.1 hypothetical protein TVAG_089640 [Trichomonas vaginalis G3]KAI5506198.1 hypothetical protein TVAGG3_0656280 [Trichomonas vaginalis G3]|eukprot:XP_001302156.1 hypothetical protein [Trichomonas vaginalis G3]
MNIEIPIDVPAEIQEQVVEKLEEKGVKKRLERKVQLGINIAIQELESNQTQDSVLMRKSTIREAKSENEALHRIYKYLQNKGLLYTYQCMKEEVASSKKRSYTNSSMRK